MECWGRESYGRLGNAGVGSANKAVSVSDLGDVVEVRAGEAHSCALDKWGSVKCWGKGENGELGHAEANKHTPATVLDGTDTFYAPGMYHRNYSCELDALSGRWELPLQGRVIYGQC